MKSITAFGAAMIVFALLMFLVWLSGMLSFERNFDNVLVLGWVIIISAGVFESETISNRSRN